MSLPGDNSHVSVNYHTTLSQLKTLTTVSDNGNNFPGTYESQMMVTTLTLSHMFTYKSPS